MNAIANLEFFWLHVANVLLGVATVAALVAIGWAAAKDVRHARHDHAH